MRSTGRARVGRQAWAGLCGVGSLIGVEFDSAIVRAS